MILIERQLLDTADFAFLGVRTNLKSVATKIAWLIYPKKPAVELALRNGPMGESIKRSCFFKPVKGAPKMPTWAKTKQIVLERDNHTCQHCGLTDNPLDIHHIIYKENGGTDDLNNLISLCENCHSKVHSTTDKEAHFKRMAPIYNKLYADKMRHLVSGGGLLQGIVLARIVKYIEQKDETFQET